MFDEEKATGKGPDLPHTLGHRFHPILINNARFNFSPVFLTLVNIHTR
jgi:hypothetical protein